MNDMYSYDPFKHSNEMLHYIWSYEQWETLIVRDILNMKYGYKGQINI